MKLKLKEVIQKIVQNYNTYDNYQKNALKTTFTWNDTNYDFTYQQLLDELNKYKSYILDTYREGLTDIAFIELFKSFKDMYLSQYQNIFRTIMDKSYNPLANYDRKDVTTHTIKGTKTNADSGTDSSTSSTPQQTITNSSVTNDSDTMKDINKSTSSSVTVTGGVTYGKSTTESYSTDYEDKIELNASGTIGTQTMAEVGGGEIKFRQYKLYAEFVQHFVFYYGYYCESEEDYE